MLETGEAAEVRIGRLMLGDGEGEFRQETCTLIPTIGRYEVIIDSETVRLPQTSSMQELVALANNTLVSILTHLGWVFTDAVPNRLLPTGTSSIIKLASRLPCGGH